VVRSFRSKWAARKARGARISKPEKLTYLDSKAASCHQTKR
jgi:hypothetical protein